MWQPCISWDLVKNTEFRPHPDLLNQNLQFNKIPSLFAHTLKFEKHSSNIFTFNSQHTDVHGITLAGVVFEILGGVRV